MSSNYVTAPNENNFWYNLQQGITTVFDAYTQYVNTTTKSQQTQSTTDVLTNPQTTQGQIFFTGQAFQSLIPIIIVVGIFIIIYNLAK